MGGDVWVLGVDVGTSRSAGAMANGTVTSLEVDGNRWMASMVLLDPDGHLVVGAAADHQAGVYPDRVERTPKRYIGGSAPLLLGGRPVAVRDAVGRLIEVFLDEGRLRRDGRLPEVTILTHPVRWGDDRREALADAARSIGLHDVQLIEEPVAAAAHYVGDQVPVGGFVGVYDLGGGTFDTAILQRTADGFETVGEPGGDEFIGGEHFDHRVFDYLGECLADDDPELWEQLQFGQDRRWTRAAADLLTQARRAKEAVSSYPSTQVLLPLVDRDVVFTRTQFEAMIRDDVEATVEEMATTIASAGLEPQDLDAIYLVGGSSRIPLVTELMTRAFGDRITTRDEPKSVVALGAAAVGRGRVIARRPSEPAPTDLSQLPPPPAASATAPASPGAPPAPHAPPPPSGPPPSPLGFPGPTAVAPHGPLAPPPPGARAAPGANPTWPSPPPPEPGFTEERHVVFQVPLVTLSASAQGVCAVDATSLVHHISPAGEWSWMVPAPAPVSVRPLLLGDRTIVASGREVLWIDGRTRSIRQRAAVTGAITASPVWVGLVLVADETGMITALDQDARPRWMLPTGQRVAARGVLTGDSVLIAVTDGKVYRVAAATGVPAWAFPAPAAVVAPPVAVGAHAVVAATDGTVYRIELSGGRAAWGAALEGAVEAAPTVRDGRVVVADRSGMITGLDLDSGRVVWRTPTGDDPVGDLVDCGPFVVATARSGQLIALDPATGRVVHRYALSGPTTTGCVAVGDRIWAADGSTLRALRLRP